MNRSELKTHAKKRLSENYGQMVLVSLISLICQGAVSATSGVKFNINYNIGDVTQGYEYQQTNPVISLLSILFGIFVASIITIGVSKFFRKNIYGNEEVGVITSGFKSNYGGNVLTMFVYSLFVSLGVVLFVVPGVIVGLGLTLVPYILAENPNISTMDAIRLSWEKMNGHKGEYFVLVLSFIGWILLDILTFGIAGVLYIHPYMNQTCASYCDAILRS